MYYEHSLYRLLDLHTAYTFMACVYGMTLISVELTALFGWVPIIDAQTFEASNHSCPSQAGLHGVFHLNTLYFFL